MSSQPRIVTPSDYLCVEEEFMPSSGTYVDNGTVRAAVVGYAVYDFLSRRVSVKPVKPLRIPKAGDTVVGVVTAVRDEIAIVKVLGFDIYNTFKNPFTGLLHISQASETRVQNLYEVVRLGDLIKAKVLNNYIPLLLSTKEPKFGVILAYCSRCGAILVKKDSNLICPRCHSVEARKASIEYLALAPAKHGRHHG